jgi:hypothetical protein
LCQLAEILDQSDSFQHKTHHKHSQKDKTTKSHKNIKTMAGKVARRAMPSREAVADFVKQQLLRTDEWTKALPSGGVFQVFAIQDNGILTETMSVVSTSPLLMDALLPVSPHLETFSGLFSDGALIKWSSGTKTVQMADASKDWEDDMWRMLRRTDLAVVQSMIELEDDSLVDLSFYDKDKTVLEARTRKGALLQAFVPWTFGEVVPPVDHLADAADSEDDDDEEEGDAEVDEEDKEEEVA